MKMTVIGDFSRACRPSSKWIAICLHSSAMPSSCDMEVAALAEHLIRQGPSKDGKITQLVVSGFMGFAAGSRRQHCGCGAERDLGRAPQPL